MRTCLFIVMALLVTSAIPSWAQDLPDSGLPDASVGGSTPEGMSEENDPSAGPCLEPKDCGQGFSCVSQRCVPTKPKTVGCTSAPELALAALAGLLLRRRRN